MSQQAISKARSHFDHSPFELMARTHVEVEYSGKYPLETWNGYHVFGVDGSTVVLPPSEELKIEFGVSGCKQECATADISILCDVLHEWIIDASISPHPQSERRSAAQHIEFLVKNMNHLEKKLVLFDRGYPSAELIELLQKNGLFFLMRCQRKWAKSIDEASEGESVQILNNGQKVRVYKFNLPSGEQETLVTNLYDVPIAQLPELYFYGGVLKENTMFSKTNWKWKTLQVTQKTLFCKTFGFLLHLV